MSHSDFPRSIRKRTIVILLAALVPSFIMVGSGTLTSISFAQVVEQLPGDKTQDSLQKYSEISALPMDKRRTAFTNTSAKDRSDFVRIHLALYLASHPDLNEEQKKVILEGMSLATAELYTESPDRKAKFAEPLRQFASRIRAVFSQEEAARIFATLGAPEPQSDLLLKYRDNSTPSLAKSQATFTKTNFRERSTL